MSLRPRIAAIAFLVPLLLAPCGALSVATHAAQPGYPAGQGTGVEKSIRRMSEVDAAGGAAVARYADRRLASMGILDVTKAPYSADPTGEEDATAAIQQALRDARDARLVTYLPAGRYRVSDTIQAVVGVVQWDTFGYEGPSDPWEYEASFEYPCVLMGSRGKGRTALVLADRASGFDDPENPKPVLFFWARSMQVPGLKQVDPDVPQSNINFNQKILSLDIELGRGNPGAIGIDHRGAEGSSVEDVAVYAEGAAAGFRHAPGSGGAMHGIRVYGGRIGLDLDGTQPSPLISDLVLKGQTEAAILASSRGPLTLVGAEIEGAGIVVRRSPVSWDAALNMVDCVLSITKGETAIESERSAVLSNVWIRGAQTALKVADHPPNAGSADGWTLVRRYAAGSEVKLPNRLGGGVWRDPVWVDGRKLQNPLADVEQSRTGPPDEVLARHRRPALPGFDTEGVVNVKDAPFGAKGDGETDDAAAIQQAIDAHPLVFVPKGKYLVSRPIKLGPQTQLFGISNLHSMLLPKYTLPVFYSALEAQATDARPPFHDPDDPQPLVETVDDAEAETSLSMVHLHVPALNPCVYALRWRAGSRSVVNSVYPSRSHWHPNAPALNHELMRVDGHGGGRWYTQTLLGGWSQGPDFRHLLVQETSEPLRFYHLQAQFGRGEAMIEFRDARNIDVYSMKAEGDFTLLWLNGCRNVRVFGHNGLLMPAHGREVFRLTDCQDVLLANIAPMLGNTGYYMGHLVNYDPRRWFILRDGDMRIGGLEQFTLYLLGNPSGPCAARFPGGDKRCVCHCLRGIAKAALLAGNCRQFNGPQAVLSSSAILRQAVAHMRLPGNFAAHSGPWK